LTTTGSLHVATPSTTTRHRSCVYGCYNNSLPAGPTAAATAAATTTAALPLPDNERLSPVS
jgi:hypothetical protein